MAALKARLRAQVGALTINVLGESKKNDYDPPLTPMVNPLNMRVLTTLRKIEHLPGSNGDKIDRLLSLMLAPLLLKSIASTQRAFRILNNLPR
jgi:hypothetical protein